MSFKFIFACIFPLFRKISAHSVCSPYVTKLIVLWCISSFRIQNISLITLFACLYFILIYFILIWLTIKAIITLPSISTAVSTNARHVVTVTWCFAKAATFLKATNSIESELAYCSNQWKVKINCSYKFWNNFIN